MCWGVNNGGYWGLANVVRIREQVQCDGLVVISVVMIIFPVFRKEDGVIFGKYDGSSFYPGICGTKVRFRHSVVQVKREKEGFPCSV